MKPLTLLMTLAVVAALVVAGVGLALSNQADNNQAKLTDNGTTPRLSGVFPVATQVTARFAHSDIYGVDNSSRNDTGSFINIEYKTAEVIGKNPTTNDTYIIEPVSGKVLAVRWVEYIGFLMSRSAGFESGYFIIDNPDFVATINTSVTILIGGHAYTDVHILAEDQY